MKKQFILAILLLSLFVGIPVDAGGVQGTQDCKEYTGTTEQGGNNDSAKCYKKTIQCPDGSDKKTKHEVVVVTTTKSIKINELNAQCKGADEVVSSVKVSVKINSAQTSGIGRLLQRLIGDELNCSNTKNGNCIYSATKTCKLTDRQTTYAMLIDQHKLLSVCGDKIPGSGNASSTNPTTPPQTPPPYNSPYNNQYGGLGQGGFGNQYGGTGNSPQPPAWTRQGPGGLPGGDGSGAGDWQGGLQDTAPYQEDISSASDSVGGFDDSLGDILGSKDMFSDSATGPSESDFGSISADNTSIGSSDVVIDEGIPANLYNGDPDAALAKLFGGDANNINDVNIVNTDTSSEFTQDYVPDNVDNTNSIIDQSKTELAVWDLAQIDSFAEFQRYYSGHVTKDEWAQWRQQFYNPNQYNWTNNLEGDYYDGNITEQKTYAWYNPVGWWVGIKRLFLSN